MDAMEQLSPNSRRKRLKKAGLRVLAPSAEPRRKLPIPKLVSLQVAEDPGKADGSTGELVVGVGELCSGEKLLTALQEDPVPLRVRSGRRGRWRVAHVNPEAFLQALIAFREVWATVKGYAMDDTAEKVCATDDATEAEATDTEGKPRRALLCVGHSLGGAVAALLAAFLGERMVLQDDTARTLVEDLLRPRMKGSASKRAAMAGEWAEELLAPLQEYFDLLNSRNPFRVRAVTFGCPPIVSSTVHPSESCRVRKSDRLTSTSCRLEGSRASTSSPRS
eukprot:scaffold3687_cov240-Pinguiococcus_pyrenoidosus.AAC.3